MSARLVEISAAAGLTIARSTRPGKNCWPGVQPSAMTFSTGPAHTRPTPTPIGTERARTPTSVARTAQPATNTISRP